MAVLIEGLQGSGKSYFAMYTMIHEQEKYWKIFSNIDGIRQTEKILPLEFRAFKNEILSECYTTQVSMDGTFEESIQILQKFHILPENPSKDKRVLIVVDEAQNYFGKTVKLEPSLQWFITQHRHLFIELFLITQKNTLLRDEYKLFNVVYYAYPPVKQFLFGKVRYAEHAGLPLNHDTFVRQFSLPKEQKVFDLYVSGDKVDSPNIFRRYFFLFLGLVLFVVLSIFVFLDTFLSDTPQTTTPTTTTTYDKKKFYEFVFWEDGYFYVRQTENREHYPVLFFEYLRQKFDMTIVAKRSIGYGMTIVSLVSDSSLLDFLSEPSPKSSIFSTADHNPDEG